MCCDGQIFGGFTASRREIWAPAAKFATEVYI